jgi:hypothetical protein
VDSARYAQIARIFAQRLTRAFNQCGVNGGAAPMVGHVREPRIQITTMVDKWEGDFLLPHKEASVYHGLQRRIRYGQRAHAIRVMDVAETGTRPGATDLKPRLLRCRAYIHEQPTGAKGGVDHL